MIEKETVYFYKNNGEIFTITEFQTKDKFTTRPKNIIVLYQKD
ncbi:hypothetical protein LEP1GSC126_3485 [Leptospira kirschneri str. 200801774]|nr:hypothetical protein LEP1GSC126_3485 [Leptospira kirschneri str. 200801774]